MAALIVTSPEKGSGKTVVCAGIGKLLQNAGKKVGYLKPVLSDSGADSDAEFMKDILSLDEAKDLLSPVVSSKGNLAGSVKEAFNKVSPGKDVVIVEGDSEQYQVSGDIAKALDARTLIIKTYSGVPGEKTESYKEAGDSLLGVVINRVPETRLEQARSEAGEHKSEYYLKTGCSSPLQLVKLPGIFRAKYCGALNNRQN